MVSKLVEVIMIVSIFLLMLHYKLQNKTMYKSFMNGLSKFIKWIFRLIYRLLTGKIIKRKKKNRVSLKDIKNIEKLGIDPVKELDNIEPDIEDESDE